MQIHEMAVIGVASRLARISGIVTIALVSVIPLMTLANDASSFLQPPGMKLLSTPQFIQCLVFGTAFAALGEMMTSFVFSCVFMYALRYFVTKDGGSYASRYVKSDVVKSVQENVFSYQQPTSS